MNEDLGKLSIGYGSDCDYTPYYFVKCFKERSLPYLTLDILRTAHLMRELGLIAYLIKNDYKSADYKSAKEVVDAIEQIVSFNEMGE